MAFEVFKQGKIQHFTSYSATGTTVATLAAKRDAEVRLMIILADQIGLGLWGILVPLFVFMTACGFTFPCVQVLALDRHGKAAGTAASILGAVNFGVAGFVSPLVGWIAGDTGITATTMAVVMVGCSVIGVLGLWLVVRPRSVQSLTP